MPTVQIDYKNEHDTLINTNSYKLSFHKIYIPIAIGVKMFL